MPSASSTARCQQPRRKTGDVVGHDWSKLVIRQADSDRTMLEELQAGNCICEDPHLHYEQLDRQRPRGPELAGPSEAPHLRLRTLRAEASGRESRGCTPTRSSTLAAPAGANGCWSTTGGGLLGPPSPSRASRGKSTTASSSASALAAHRQERCGF
ncbi:unnamed protein product [Prorocentrum cordatum]|uniref:Uncharacterized protein n=1 Tax=Prorocentrum cordatum TaxID=2364126 RepID=A0ABN9UCW7_9DINO|nr:unnamed protein product [Polarella glacialis]